MPGACEGLRVLELGSGMSVALAGMTFADNGAEVIKVEPPAGDRMRGTAAWPTWARGKRSVVLDLHDVHAQEQFHQLVATADVVLQNFRPGVAERFGAGYETLRAINPGLISCHITGFGDRSPRSGIPAYDSVVAAANGLMQHYANLIGNSHPNYMEMPTPSYGAAMGAVQGVLAALRVRRATGRGQEVRTTLNQAWLAFEMMDWLMVQWARKFPEAFAVPSKQLAGSAMYLLALLVGRTRDGHWVQFNNLTLPQFHAFRRAMGLDDAWVAAGGKPGEIDIDASDEAGRDRFWDAFLDRMREKTLAEWTEIFLRDPDVGFEALREPAAALDHPQMLHNGHVIAVKDPVLGPTRQVGPLATMSGTPGPAPAPAPALGQDQALLASLPDAPGTPQPARPAARPGPRHPLEGVTIIEAANFYAGPLGPALLADLGARVIKLESFAGDPMRFFIPSVPEVGGVKVVQGKESVAVDLMTESGRRILHELAARADVVMTGYRPAAARKMGLDYEAIRRANPRAVYVYAGGYGFDGPYCDRPMYAITAGTITGHSLRTMGALVPPPGAEVSNTDLKRLSSVIKSGNRGDGDPVAALAVATAILLGLEARDRTGEGQQIHTSMMCSNAHLQSDVTIDYAGVPPLPRTDPDILGMHALERLYPAAGGWVFLAAPQEKEWVRLCRALSREAWLTDPRFATAAARRAHDAALAAELEAVFRTAPADDWEAKLVPAGVACIKPWQGRMADLTVDDPVYRQSGWMVPVEHPLLGEHLRHGPIVELSDTPWRPAPGCLIGQHTRDVLAELGYSDQDIDRLHAERVVQS